MNFKHLKKWEHPSDYMGETWYDYYVFLGKSRDSDLLELSNFEVGLENLGGESETVVVVRNRHWAVGWIEFIAIHESDTKALELAEKMKEDLENYPVLNDEDYSEKEFTQQGEELPEAVKDLVRDADDENFDATEENVSKIVNWLYQFKEDSIYWEEGNGFPHLTEDHIKLAIEQVKLKALENPNQLKLFKN